MSQQTVRNYRDVLVAARVIEVRSDGWRCVLGREAGSTGENTGRRNVEMSSIAEQVEDACRDNRCGESVLWMNVVEALLRSARSDSSEQSDESDSSVTSKNSSSVVIELGPSVQQESIVSWDSDPNDQDTPRDGSNRKCSDGSDSEVDVDFSGVTLGRDLEVELEI
jgi:hypothetical protein